MKQSLRVTNPAEIAEAINGLDLDTAQILLIVYAQDNRIETLTGKPNQTVLTILELTVEAYRKALAVKR